MSEMLDARVVSVSMRSKALSSTCSRREPRVAMVIKRKMRESMLPMVLVLTCEATAMEKTRMR